MGKYILKRCGYIVLVFMIVSFLMFSLYNLIPSDPARAELEPMRQSFKNPAEYEARYQALREEMGLNDPLVVRYLRWMGLWTDTDGKSFNGLLEGNFGYSNYYKRNVIDVIVDPMSNTIFINIFSTIAALGITIPLGIFCAVRKNGKFDQTTQVVTMLGYSIPVYIIALVFMFIFCIVFRIFPVMGIKTAGATYASGWDEFVDKLYHITLPVIVMTFGSLGGMTRYVRSAMIESLSMDYIRTARAKGLREKVVIYSHAWRNALLPIITSILGWFLSIFSGSVVIENTFGLSGMGRLYWIGLNNNDFELVLAIQMFYSIVSLVGALLIDISYGLVDPRVRVDK
ncbi:MAG: ABC transporter permease [Clostridia bacterium]|nr:ABC transporter permease [Clostridia bacterium]